MQIAGLGGSGFGANQHAEDPERLFEVAQGMDDLYRARVLESSPHALAETDRWPDAGSVLERAVGAANGF